MTYAQLQIQNALLSNQVGQSQYEYAIDSGQKQVATQGKVNPTMGGGIPIS